MGRTLLSFLHSVLAHSLLGNCRSFETLWGVLSRTVCFISAYWNEANYASSFDLCCCVSMDCGVRLRILEEFDGLTFFVLCEEGGRGWLFGLLLDQVEVSYSMFKISSSFCSHLGWYWRSEKRRKGPILDWYIWGLDNFRNRILHLIDNLPLFDECHW